MSTVMCARLQERNQRSDIARHNPSPVLQRHSKDFLLAATTAHQEIIRAGQFKDINLIVAACFLFTSHGIDFFLFYCV